jgi:hypothetical protein
MKFLIRDEVFTAAKILKVVYWVINLHSLIGGNKYSYRTFCFHFKRRHICAGSRFLQNVGNHLRTHAVTPQYATIKMNIKVKKESNDSTKKIRCTRKWDNKHKTILYSQHRINPFALELSSVLCKTPRI